MSDQLGMALWLAAGMVGVILSALYSGLETGIYALNRIRLRLRNEAGDPRARTLFTLLRNRRSLLGTLLIGNNIANYLGTSGITAFCSYTVYWQLEDWQIAIVVPVVIAPILLLFGEIVPKNIFQFYTDRYTYYFAGMLRWSRRIFLASGLLPLVDALTTAMVRLTSGRVGADAQANLFHPRQQVGQLLRESHHEGPLSEYQSALVERVMNLRNVNVGQVMVPIGKAWSVAEGVGRGELLETLRRHNHSRMPVYRGRRDEVIGLLNIYEVMADDSDRPIAEFTYDTVRIHRDSSVVNAIFDLQSARRAMGLVTDDRGHVVGIATIKDLVEEITGDIEEW